MGLPRLAVNVIQNVYFVMEELLLIAHSVLQAITCYLEELRANTQVRFRNALVLSMVMILIQIIQLVLLVMQHALYVLIQLSQIVRDATVDGGWLSLNVRNVMKLVRLVQVFLLMNALVLVQEISSKMPMFLAAPKPAQPVSIKKQL